MARHNLTAEDADDFTISNQAQLLSTVSSVGDTLTLLLAGIASISLVVGGIGIMNIMLVSVRERTREIGIRKAIGARGRDILAQFLVEALALSLLGGLIGVAIGIAGVARDRSGRGLALHVQPADGRDRRWASRRPWGSSSGSGRRARRPASTRSLRSATSDPSLRPS